MTKIRAALPVMAEMEYLPHCLNSILTAAEGIDFILYVCVNQPESYWTQTEKLPICKDNEQCLAYLRGIDDKRIRILDYSSPGKGWQGKKHGVGHARRIAMDAAIADVVANALLVSLDADTEIPADYFKALIDSFYKFPQLVGMALPYYHRLTGNEAEDRAVLRYELYMRAYSLNLWRIKSPYRFTALGSAMACPVEAYRKIGGISPKMSGEDFYFLQKLRKLGSILVHQELGVYPASRFSDRVFFGTGPAMIKGNSGDWTSYPFYPDKYFDEIREFYEFLPKLYQQDYTGTVQQFLTEVNKGKNPWPELRANVSSRAAFEKAVHIRFDGLRTLQYIRSRYQSEEQSDETSALKSLIKNHFPQIGEAVPEIFTINNLEEASIPILNDLRNSFVKEETKLQKACPII